MTNQMTQAETKLLRALQFCLDMADEEYPHQLTNPGAEIVLRHIARKCREALADYHGESP
jgi:hypothetical protein